MKRLSIFSFKNHNNGSHGAASRSQALLEFALALPILLMLLFGIIDLAALFQAWLTVENIARQTVRYAVTGQYDPAFCVDGPDDGPEACAGDDWEDEQDAARLLSVQAYADRQTVALFFTPGAAQTEIGHLNAVVCSSRDADPKDGTPDFTFFKSTSTEYADCQLAADGTHAEDAGAPGDRVIIAVDFNHPYITPIFNQVWPMTHLFSHREGIVEQFRVPRLIALPPDVGLPTLTPSNTPPPTETFTPPPPTSTPLPIYIEIVSPNPSGVTITNVSQTRFEAIAWNPPYGSTNGDGIKNITFWFAGPGTIPGRTESGKAYCAFSGNGPCNTMDSVVDWRSLPNGTYTIYARATGVDDRLSVIASKTFILNFPPTPTPTITRTPTATPVPSCNDVFITLTEIRNNSSSSDFRVTVRNNNYAPGLLTSSRLTWNSPYSPPLYFDYFWFLNTNAENRYYNPSGTNLYDTTNGTITWANAAGAPAPLAQQAKTIWGARFNRAGQPALAGNFNVWLTFTFPVLGECAVSTTLVQPTPTITATQPTPTITRTPTKTPIPPPASKTFTPTNTLAVPPTRTPTRTSSVPSVTPTWYTSTPLQPTKTPTPTITPTICFDC
jgi:hypothetical protein